MTLDHAAKIIGQNGLMTLFPDMSLHTSFLILELMEGIGRIAFPLFAFMIAEGAAKTRSMPKYIGRLVLFAVISEPFFYYAFSVMPPTLSDFLHDLSRLRLANVFFTLALGLTAIFIYQLLERKQSKKLLLLYIPVCLIFLFIAEYVHCDYGMSGIFLIVFLFLAKTQPQKAIVIAVWSFGLYVFGQAFGLGFSRTNVSIFDIADCIFAALSYVFIRLYNGERGRPLKWCFYIYYPAHLLLLSCVGAFLTT